MSGGERRMRWRDSSEAKLFTASRAMIAITLSHASSKSLRQRALPAPAAPARVSVATRLVEIARAAPRWRASTWACCTTASRGGCAERLERHAQRVHAGRAMAVASSRGSRPMRQAPNHAASATERANTPTVSSVGAERDGCRCARSRRSSACSRPRRRRPRAGSPSPASACRWPRARSPAATAAAEPLEEPPGVCAGFHGLRVLPGWRKANSVVTVLPITRPPSASRRRTIQAEWLGTLLAKMREPMRVGMPRVAMMSFTPRGCRRAEGRRGCRRRAPRPRPWRAGRSNHSQAWTRGSSAAMRAEHAAT